jgi:hypothetical protein
MRHAWKLGSALVVALAAMGCASSPALRTESSTSAIRAAEAVGANQVPQASLHLQLSKEELEDAEKLAKDGKKEQADSMLQRAEADAELAILLSTERTEQAQATRAMERVQKLRSDNLTTP